MTSSVKQTTAEMALLQHNRRITAIERSDGSNRWIYVNPQGGPDTDPEGPEFQNGWTNVGSPDADLAFKRFLNWVHLRGAFTGGSDGTVVFTLPEAYRPMFRQQMLLPLGDGSGWASVLIDTTGDVTYVTQGT